MERPEDQLHGWASEDDRPREPEESRLGCLRRGLVSRFKQVLRLVSCFSILLEKNYNNLFWGS